MATDGVRTAAVEAGEAMSKVLVLTGATAVGKTATSIQLAKELNGEIISADSVQVYKGLDIGSDKIRREEMEGIPHHLIDILDPTEEFSAGHFYYLAMEAIDDILRRNKTPIVVGGTGFYLRWLVSGKPSTPTATKESEAKAREALEECFKNATSRTGDELSIDEKWKIGVDLVRSLGDSETADRLLYQEVNNWYRMNRVVDILLQAPGKTLADLDRDDNADPEYDFRCFFLVRPRIQLYRRIDERVEVMLTRGLITETAEKLCHVAQPDSNCATRAIGYRQTMLFLDKWARADVKEDLGSEHIINLAKDIQTASRQLCHKQMHWFRKEEKFRWIQADGLSTGELVKELVHHWEKEEHQGGGALKRTRLTKEEERELKLYIPEMKHLTGDCLQKILDEARVAIKNVGSMHASGALKHIHCAWNAAILNQKNRIMNVRRYTSVEERMPTVPPRRPDVTDGAWDSADEKAVEQALKDASKISRLGEKYGVGQVILGKSLEELEQMALEDGQPAYRGKQLKDAVMKGTRHIQDISNIPKAWREALIARGVQTGRSELHHEVVSKDGTRKFLLKLFDSYVVETVGIPADGSNRLTVCVSSQVGCPMRCTFCATGKGGFARNLLPHEIIDQVLTVGEAFGERISNVVFMGMGDPGLNLPSVMRAHHALNKDLNIGARHITISTVGIPNAIHRFAEYNTQSTLAVSIHAPNQRLREQIVPSAKSYPLDALMRDCSEYFEMTGRRVTFEYTLLHGVNDDPAHAEQLAALLQAHGNMRSHVNVIPWNPVDDSEFKRPSKNGVRKFVQILERNGIRTSIRVTRGLEAAAACGQLRNRHQAEPVIS